jgi:hypothetical protein
MAMNKQRRTSNLNNIVRYDTSGNVSLPAGLTVEGLDAGFVKSDANGLFSIDTGAYLPTPSQSGNAGKYLTTDGSVLSWGTVSIVNIYNSNGTLDGNRTVTFGSNSLTFLKTIALATNAEGLDLKNDTVSTISNNSYSPSFTLSGFGWGGTSGNTLSRIRQYLVPVSGSPWNQPTLRWDGWNAYGDWVNLMTLKSYGFGGGNPYGGLTVGGLNIGTTLGQIDNGSSSSPIVIVNGNGNGGIKLQGWNQYIEMKASTGISFHNGTSEMGRFYTATGNLLIQTGGTYADAGYKLDVQGTARFTGKLSIISNPSVLSLLTGIGNIGTTSIFFGANSETAQIQSTADGINDWVSIRLINGVTHWVANRNNLYLNNSIITNPIITAPGNTTLTQLFNLNGGTGFNSMGFYLISAGSNAEALRFDIAIKSGAYPSVSNSDTAFSIFANKNIGIGSTTDSGFKLDVQGTFKIGVRPGIGGQQAITFTYDDVYNTIQSGSWTFFQSTYGLFIGAGNGQNVYLGVNNADQLSSVGIGYFAWQAISASAILDIKSTTKGFLQPRMTTVQRDAITSPATGLSVYNTTTNTNDYYNGTSWISGGINIYNSDGTLTGDRLISVGANRLAIQTNYGFSANNANPSTNIFTIRSSTNENAISVWSNGAVGIGRNAGSASAVNGYALAVDNGNNTGIYTGGLYSVGQISANNGSITLGIYGSKSINIFDGASDGYVSYTTANGIIVSSGSYAGVNYNTTLQVSGGKGIRIFGPTGNVVVGGSTFTDSGYKIDVQGSGRFTGGILINNGSVLTYGPNGGIIIGEGASIPSLPNSSMIAIGNNAKVSMVLNFVGGGIAIGNNSEVSGAGVSIGGDSKINSGVNINSGNLLTKNGVFIQGNMGSAPTQVAVLINGNATNSGGSNAGTSVTIGGSNYGDNSVAIAAMVPSGEKGVFVVGQPGDNNNFADIDSAISNVYFGSGISRTKSDGTTQRTGYGWPYAINGSGARGTDFAGGSITIAGGKGTGTGAPGDVIFSTATTTASGTTLQSLTNRVWIKGENGNVGIGASPDAAYKIDVLGTGRFSNTLSVISTATTNETAVFRSVEPYISIEAAGASNAASLFFRPSTASQNATIQNRTGGGIEFYTGATPSEVVRFAANGNVGINNNNPGQKLSVSGNSQINHAYTHTSGVFTSGLSSFTDVTTGSSPSYTSGMFYGAFQSYYKNEFSANATIPNSAIQASQFNGSQIRFVNANTAITMTQGSSTVRAYANQILQFSFDNAQTSCSVSHVAGMQILSPYYQGANNPTITNYYGLILNDSTEYNASMSVTTRWGIYQDGASDNNYFKGKVVIGSTNTVGSSPLNVKNLPTSSSGLATGDIWNDAGTLKIV